MKAQPSKEHQWLQKLVGEWTYEAQAEPAKPGDPPMRFSGTETVRLLGGLWAVAEGQGEMPGHGPATTILTIGYDPDKKRYVGTWIGSMMTTMYVYDGTLEANGKALALDTEGPGMDGKHGKFRETIEFTGEDLRTFTSRMLNPDGNWKTLMVATYRRKK